MSPLSGYHGSGALFVLTSAALHLLAPLAGTFSAEAFLLVPFGCLCLLLAAGLTRRMRWVAWLSFFVMGIACIVTIGQFWQPSRLPAWWWTLILIADALAVLALFAALWRPAPEHLAHGREPDL